jgi:hypothetical protein
MSNNQEPQGKTRKVSRFAVFMIVVALIAAAFGGGALLVYVQFRNAEAAWKQEKADIEANNSTQTAELTAAKTRETFWRLYEGFSSVYIELTEKNFGLVQSEITTLKTALTAAPAGLDAEVKKKLESLMTEIASNADALNPEIKNKAREARELLKKILEK